MNGSRNADKALEQIKAVTFDVGGTLIEPWPSVGHVYAEVAARHGLREFSAEQLNTRFKTSWRARKNFEHSRHEWAELVNEVFGISHAEPFSETFFSELYERFATPDAWRVFEDVVPALDTLAARGIRLGIISNWDERLRGLLRKLKLERYFVALTVSREVGFPKPSGVIFRQAAAELGLSPGAILHVGDSLEMDVAGAKTAGFQALQIHRGADSVDGQLRSLAELSAKIGNPLPIN
ncbi:MAG TPA: HAD-IA family hydrolase [Verrucomicrobiae bacterium]|jgi:putative hydrolase of the HAD superfamily|nr:HAD-IA family hydrolase [Verrucomicrobiae bacterium]